MSCRYWNILVMVIVRRTGIWNWILCPSLSGVLAPIRLDFCPIKKKYHGLVVLALLKIVAIKKYALNTKLIHACHTILILLILTENSWEAPEIFDWFSLVTTTLAHNVRLFILFTQSILFSAAFVQMDGTRAYHPCYSIFSRG